MNRSRLVFFVGAAVLILVGAAVIVYGVTRPTPAPEPGLSAPATDTSSLTPGTLNVDQLSGQWKLAEDGKSFVGYRIDEEYTGVPGSSTVTGRTSAVQAALVVVGRDVRTVAVQADVTQLKSDDPKRDEALKTRGLETEKYQRAIFATTQDINLLSVPPPGTEATFHVVGEINLHGTRKPIELDLKAQLLVGDQPVIEAVGAQTVNLRDFGIEPPDVAGLLTVKDQGALEFKLRFVRA